MNSEHPGNNLVIYSSACALLLADELGLTVHR